MKKSTKKKQQGPIKASEVIKILKSGKVKSEVVNDADCYPVFYSASLSADDKGRCSINCSYGYHEDTVRYSVDIGSIEFDVKGVSFWAARNVDGSIDPYQISGREIDYDDDLTEDDIIEAANDYVEYKGYDPDDYPFDESEVTDSDIIDVIDIEPQIFVENRNGKILGFDNSDDIPPGCKVIDTEKAVQRLVKDRKNVSFDFG